MEYKYVLGVDLDGVCADYNAGFRQIAADELGVNGQALPIRTSWGFEEWGIDDEEFNRLHQKAVTEQRMLAKLPVIQGCAESLWRLSDAGVWIRIITHRLYRNWGHKEAITDTVTWLDQAQVPYRDICFLGAKPEVQADLYIDDAPHNIAALRAAGNDVIAFGQPYNQNIEKPRVTSWEELEQLALNYISQKSVVQPQLPGIDAGANRLQVRKSSDGETNGG